MRFRKLRIAWSGFWGLACVLLVLLWVRSLNTCDLSIKRGADGWMKTTLCSSHGTLEFVQSRDDVAGTPDGWHYVRIDGCGEPAQTFAFKVASARKCIRIPDWLPLMFFMGAAIKPCVRWRYSLRTLLIATTILAVALGLIVYSAQLNS